ncbi:MAG: hypothetical protein P8Y93_01660 [Acidobacteriota bacterium]
MTSSCPWCLEPLPARTSEALCPLCGRSLGEEAGLQARSLRFRVVEAAQRENFRRMLIWGLPAVAILAVVTPFLHFAAVAAVPLVIGTHLAVARIVLARPAKPLLGPMRRLLLRWLARFTFLWVGIPGYGSMTVPVFGVVTGTATFAALTSIVYLSTLHGLRRERAGRPLARWEKVVPIALAVLTVGFLLAAVGLGLLLGWSVTALVDSMRA